MLIGHLFLAVLWIMYCVLHSVLAARSVKQKLKASMNQNFKYYRLVYTVFAFVFFAAILYYEIRLPTIQFFNRVQLVFYSGILIGSAGLVLMSVCIFKYFMGLSGLRSLFKESTSAKLMVTGIHRFVRPPLYLGTFAFIWGLFLIIPFLSLFISNTIITIYTLVGISLEEKKLVAEFGESYLNYQATVPKLLPIHKRN